MFTSWFWMGVIFHRYQQRTPQTWRPETGRNHLLSCAIQFGACIAIATMYLLVTRAYGSPFGLGLHGALRFAAVAWMAIAAPVAIEMAIYVNLHPLVVMGVVINWLTTTVLASAITAWWSAPR